MAQKILHHSSNNLRLHKTNAKELSYLRAAVFSQNRNGEALTNMCGFFFVFFCAISDLEFYPAAWYVCKVGVLLF